MKITRFSETLESLYRRSGYQISDDGELHKFPCEKYFIFDLLVWWHSI